MCDDRRNPAARMSTVHSALRKERNQSRIAPVDVEDAEIG